MSQSASYSINCKDIYIYLHKWIVMLKLASDTQLFFFISISSWLLNVTVCISNHPKYELWGREIIEGNLWHNQVRFNPPLKRTEGRLTLRKISYYVKYRVMFFSIGC